jgi:predicted transposase YdaD
MPHSIHEERFLDVLHFLTGREIAQEISMPRKARRLDAVCRFLAALLADRKLPTVQAHALQEAIMNGQIQVSDIERETVAQRVRREGREEGLEEGREEGREEGARAALLALAARFAPDALSSLRSIRDLTALQQAVDAALAQRLGG